MVSSGELNTSNPLKNQIINDLKSHQIIQPQKNNSFNVVNIMPRDNASLPESKSPLLQTPSYAGTGSQLIPTDSSLPLKKVSRKSVWRYEGMKKTTIIDNRTHQIIDQKQYYQNESNKSPIRSEDLYNEFNSPGHNLPVPINITRHAYSEQEKDSPHVKYHPRIQSFISEDQYGRRNSHEFNVYDD